MVKRGHRSHQHGLRPRFDAFLELSMECSDEPLSTSQVESFNVEQKEYDTAMKLVRDAKAGRLPIQLQAAAEAEAAAKALEAEKKLQQQQAAAAAAQAMTSTEPDIIILGDSTSTTASTINSSHPVPQQVYKFVNLQGQPLSSQWVIRPLMPVMPQQNTQKSATIVEDIKKAGQQNQYPYENPPDNSALKRTAVYSEQHLEYVSPNKKKKDSKKSEVENSGPGTLVPLDEYYYGKKEGDPTYREDKGEYRFKCWYCSKMLYNNVRTMTHMQGHIDSEKQQNLDLTDLTQCRHCYKQFDTPFEMQTHIEKVHMNNANVLMCRICEKDHDSRGALTSHMRQFHNACEMPYICHVCHFQSSMYSDVVDHFKKKHDSSEGLLCLYCLRVFHVKFVAQGWGMTQNYYHHLLRHQSKTNAKKCSLCKLTFFNVADVKSHKKKDHAPNQKGVIGINAKYTTPDQVMIRVPEAGLEPKNNSGIKSLNAPAVSKIKEHRGLVFPDAVNHVHCIECKMLMGTQDHYKKYIQCSMCRFATSCSFAYANHMMGFHSGQMTSLALNIPRERPTLMGIMYCLCGFGSKYGNKIANHLVGCSKRSCYKEKPEVIPREEREDEMSDPRKKPGASLLDVLGLVKKPNLASSSTAGSRDDPDDSELSEMRYSPTPDTPPSNSPSPLPSMLEEKSSPPELTGAKRWDTVKLKDRKPPTKKSVFLGASDSQNEPMEVDPEMPKLTKELDDSEREAEADEEVTEADEQVTEADKASEQVTDADEASERVTDADEASEQVINADEASEQVTEADEASEKVNEVSAPVTDAEEASKRVTEADEASEQVTEANEASEKVNEASEQVDEASEQVTDAEETSKQVTEADEASEQVTEADEASEKVNEVSEQVTDAEEASKRVTEADEASEHVTDADEASEQVNEASELVSEADEASEKVIEASEQVDEASEQVTEADEESKQDSETDEAYKDIPTEDNKASKETNMEADMVSKETTVLEDEQALKDIPTEGDVSKDTATEGDVSKDIPTEGDESQSSTESVVIEKKTENICVENLDGELPDSVKDDQKDDETVVSVTSVCLAAAHSEQMQSLDEFETKQVAGSSELTSEENSVSVEAGIASDDTRLHGNARQTDREPADARLVEDAERLESELEDMETDKQSEESGTELASEENSMFVEARLASDDTRLDGNAQQTDEGLADARLVEDDEQLEGEREYMVTDKQSEESGTELTSEENSMSVEARLASDDTRLDGNAQQTDEGLADARLVEDDEQLEGELEDMVTDKQSEESGTELTSEENSMSVEARIASDETRLHGNALQTDRGPADARLVEDDERLEGELEDMETDKQSEKTGTDAYTALEETGDQDESLNVEHFMESENNSAKTGKNILDADAKNRVNHSKTETISVENASVDADRSDDSLNSALKSQSHEIEKVNREIDDMADSKTEDEKERTSGSEVSVDSILDDVEDESKETTVESKNESVDNMSKTTDERQDKTEVVESTNNVSHASEREEQAMEYESHVSTNKCLARLSETAPVCAEIESLSQSYEGSSDDVRDSLQSVERTEDYVPGVDTTEMDKQEPKRTKSMLTGTKAKEHTEVEKNSQSSEVKDQDSVHGHVEEQEKGHVEERAQGHVEERAQSKLEEHAKGHVEEQAKGHVEEHSQSHMEDQAKAHVEEHSQSLMEEQAKGHVEEQAKGHVEEQAHGSGHERLQDKGSVRDRDDQDDREYSRDRDRKRDRDRDWDRDRHDHHRSDRDRDRDRDHRHNRDRRDSRDRNWGHHQDHYSGHRDDRGYNQNYHGGNQGYQRDNYNQHRNRRGSGDYHGSRDYGRGGRGRGYQSGNYRGGYY